MIYRENERAADLGCPRCGVTLKRVDDAGFAFGRCEKCQGVWLDSMAMMEFIASCEIPAAGSSGHAAARLDGLLDCPECGDELRRRHFLDRAAVIVDECLDCGTWFDAGELASAARFIRSEAGQRRLAQLRRMPLT